MLYNPGTKKTQKTQIQQNKLTDIWL